MPVVPHFEAARRKTLVRHLADFPVGSFAFVMATGIVSIAARQLGLSHLSLLLFLLNAVVFPALSPSPRSQVRGSCWWLSPPRRWRTFVALLSE
jgi:hypothetical protein